MWGIWKLTRSISPAFSRNKTCNNSNNEIAALRSENLWCGTLYNKSASVGSSGGDFSAGIPPVPKTSRPSRERIRVRSTSLGRLHCSGHPDTAEEPRLQPPHLAAFSTFSWIYVGISQSKGTNAQCINLITFNFFFCVRFTPFCPSLDPSTKSVLKSQENRERSVPK